MADEPQQVPHTALHPGDQPVNWAPDGAKEHLLSMCDYLRQRLSHFHATDFASHNKAELNRREMLRSAFSALRSAGVNPGDRASVRAFMDKLQKISPQRAQMFEAAMHELLGGSFRTESKAANMNTQMTPDETVS